MFDIIDINHQQCEYQLAMQLTWLADTPESRRRTRALRACADCQRRKKRCRHFAPHLGTQVTRGGRNFSPVSTFNTNDPQENGQSVTDGRQPRDDTAVCEDRAAISSSSSTFPRTERFVGDLNPESVLLGKLDEPSEKSLRSRVGIWISSPSLPREDDNRKRSITTGDITSGSPREHGSLDGPSFASSLNQAFIAAMKSCEILPLSTRNHLIPIYLARVNHILPLLDKDSFLLAYSNGRASVFLERAICLVAAKDKTAASHLRLTADGPIVTSRQFCSDVYKGLVAAMNAGLESDRTTRICTLALMSLHYEGYEGAEAASMHLCQAIHQAQTAGLHLDRPGRTPEDPLTKLFWCLWALDKVHASIGGRPILLADRDIGLERPDVKPRGPRSAFDVWFTISSLLSTVISFYRPSADDSVGWEESFPTFEDIVGVNTHSDLDFATLGFLELYYHAVGILSCRPKPSDRFDGSKPSFTRQSLAAMRIYSIVASECSQDLPPLSIVPYALTLSMSVSYQQLRSSKLITHFDRAKASLDACCSLLEGLSIYWFSAEAMARLGRRALRQIEGLTVGNPGIPQVSEPKPSTEKKISKSSVNPASTDLTISCPASAVEVTQEDRSALSGYLPTSTERPGDALELIGLQLSNPENTGRDEFTDIDTLFGDFLDLSLPTNFGDPIFFAEENVEIGQESLG